METKEKVVVNCKNHWIQALIPAILTLLSLAGLFVFLFRGQFKDVLIMLVPTALFAPITFLDT